MRVIIEKSRGNLEIKLLKLALETQNWNMEAANTLARLLRTRYNLSQHEGKGIKDAITNVLTDLAIPLGVNLGTKILD
ncbi:MAG: hypothetical protein MUP21_01960 [Dehalococcoidia bacterium]|nr:hypothetical protein [Dehalococcoidia bacterium]